MIVKETPWEKRNLGVIGCEFYIEREERWTNIRDVITEHEAEYKVLHVESGNVGVLIEAQKAGFVYIEMNIKLRGVLQELGLPSIYQRFIPHLSYSFANKDEIDQIKAIIRSGEMFTTDKISVDPQFGTKIAGNRYALWTQDVLDAGAKLMIANYRDDAIGFDVLVNHGDDTVEAFLGGILPKSTNCGFGFAPLYLAIEASKKMGLKKMITGISSNNLPILKIHEAFGFKIVSTSYALIKHGEE